MIQRVARRALGSFRRPSRRTGDPAFEALESRRLWAAVAQEIIFEDVGVGGSAPFHVSDPLYVSLAPFGNSADIDNFDSYDEVYDQTFGPLRAQIAIEEADSLIGPLDVFGMPVMAGKVVVMDARPLNSEDPLELGTMKTYVYNPGTPFDVENDEEDPGIAPTNLHVDLSYAAFDRFTTVSPAGAPGPTLRHNPFIGPNPLLAIDPTLPPDNTPGVTISEGGRSFTGSFLLDTGAVASMVSQHAAGAIGVTYAEGTYGSDDPRLVDAAGNTVPNQFALTIGGVGGSTKVAGFFMDSLSLQTREGAPIRYLGAPVLVADITVADPETGDELTLDGIFGDNFLVATAFIDENSPFPFPENITAGPYDWITFDEPNGVLGLNMAGVTPVRGEPVDIEGVQPVALDMPRVNALLRWTADGEPMVASEEGIESFNIMAFFDTGASGVLLSRETAEALGVGNATFAAPQGVVGRHVFYNNSIFDDFAVAANADDDDAIAPDKRALIGGEAATFANVSSYAKGINGLMVDLTDLAAGANLTAADFSFRVRDTASGAPWAAAPAPIGVTVRRGAGVDDTDRVTITWPDGAIRNTWLEVMVLPNARTGLELPDVFYVGNLVGETGEGGAGGSSTLTVNALDLAGVRREINSVSDVIGRFDFDRNGRVNALDLAAVRANYNRTLGLITPPPPPPEAAASRLTPFSITREIL